jgi:hypothetical protein
MLFWCFKLWVIGKLYPIIAPLAIVAGADQGVPARIYIADVENFFGGILMIYTNSAERRYLLRL